VRAALAAARPGDEVIVLDDQSTDGTGERLDALAAAHPERLRVLRGAPLPAGWIGKPHACHQLAQAARGELLVFFDADVTLGPDLGDRAHALLDAYRADVLTGFPRQRYGSLAERVVLPLLPLSFAAWIPLDAVWRRPEPWLLAVSGQVMAFRREAYAAIGGYASIRGAIVDDMAICALAKRQGRRVLFATLTRSATCRMYDRPAAMWEGFTKNLYAGLGRSPLALTAVIGLYASAFLLPPARLAAGWPAPAWEAVAGTVAAFLAPAALALRLRAHDGPRGLATAAVGVVLQPLAVLAFLALAIGSARRTARGTLTWRGRALPSSDEAPPP
jgi:hypothetical protein